MTVALLTDIGNVLGGFLIGFLTFYYLLKYKVKVVKDKGDYLVIELPVVGEIKTMFRNRFSGIFIDEWEELRQKTKKLKNLINPELVLRYAREFRIEYIGLEGDMKDECWSRDKLAYCAPSNSQKGGYNIYLNPSLDLTEISRRLSQDVGEQIYPSEVQAFLFLHEVGHTPQAGNQNYFTAKITYYLTGGRRSVKRRRVLNALKKEIEEFADQFALRELKRWRSTNLNSRRIDYTN